MRSSSKPGRPANSADTASNRAMPAPTSSASSRPSAAAAAARSHASASPATPAMPTTTPSMPRRSLLAHLGVWLWIGWMAFYFFLTFALGPLLALAACHGADVDADGWCSTLLFPLAATLRILGGVGFSAGVISWLTIDARWTLVAVLVPFIASALAPVGRHRQPKWLLKFGSWIIRWSQNYFDLRTVVEDEAALALPQNKTALFLLEPHGVLPLSIVGFDGSCIKTHPRSIGAISGACFKVPIMRHFYTWTGAETVDRRNLERNLAAGISVALCPGGVQEAALVDTIPNTLRLYFRERRGCIRLAMRLGVPVVPCFAFGSYESFTIVGGATMNRSPLLKTIGRAVGALPMFFLGIFGIPFAPPPPAQYTNIIGRPIDCGRGLPAADASTASASSPSPSSSSPTAIDEKRVDELMEQCIAELERLYAKYKEQYGMQHVHLSIE